MAEFCLYIALGLSVSLSANSCPKVWHLSDGMKSMVGIEVLVTGLTGAAFEGIWEFTRTFDSSKRTPGRSQSTCCAHIGHCLLNLRRGPASELTFYYQVQGNAIETYRNIQKFKWRRGAVSFLCRSRHFETKTCTAGCSKRPSDLWFEGQLEGFHDTKLLLNLIDSYCTSFFLFPPTRYSMKSLMKSDEILRGGDVFWPHSLCFQVRRLFDVASHPRLWPGCVGLKLLTLWRGFWEIKQLASTVWLAIFVSLTHTHI